MNEDMVVESEDEGNFGGSRIEGYARFEAFYHFHDQEEFMGAFLGHVDDF